MGESPCPPGCPATPWQSQPYPAEGPQVVCTLPPLLQAGCLSSLNKVKVESAVGFFLVECLSVSSYSCPQPAPQKVDCHRAALSLLAAV
ncbi:hypothetical protein MC885_012511 [Smutsia gigantea]|nr:hypothetical protein MC885_012511 [Smutsia gigantea]